MELLGGILSFHQSYSTDIPASSQVHHRIAYTVIAVFTVKLLQTILPPEKVSVLMCVSVHSRNHIHNAFFAVFFLSCFNSKREH